MRCAGEGPVWEPGLNALWVLPILDARSATAAFASRLNERGMERDGTTCAGIESSPPICETMIFTYLAPRLPSAPCSSLLFT